MFITVDGFNRTGIPSALWEFMEPYAQINCTSGIAVLALVILFLSNLASNVPTGSRILHTSSFFQHYQYLFFYPFYVGLTLALGLTIRER